MAIKTINLSLHEQVCSMRLRFERYFSHTVKDLSTVKDLEQEEADTIHAKISLKLQNSKPPKDNLCKDECKALKELQSDTSIVILPADKGRSAVILNREDYLGRCMDYINNGPYQLL